MPDTHPQPDYNFIVNPAAKPKKSLLPSGSSKQGRIFVFLGGIVLLLILIIIMSSLLSSAGKSEQKALLKVAQDQSELIRVSGIGIKTARDPSTANLATTVNLSMESDQASLLTVFKANAKQLALGKNTKTDIVLTTAEQSNNFDTVFAQTMKVELTAYQKDVKSAYNGSKNKKTKALLATQFTHATTLISK